MAARLFGVPFLLAGGYFGYHLIGGVLHPGEMTIAGWIMLPLMMAAFLVPGWILCFGRKRTRLDSARREVIEEFDFMVHTRRTVLPVRSESVVRLRYQRGATSSSKGAFVTRQSTGYGIHVDVVTGNQDALIGLFNDGDKAEALAFAAKAAAFLSIPVKDKMVEGGLVTSGGVVVDEQDFKEIEGEDEEEEEGEKERA